MRAAAIDALVGACFESRMTRLGMGALGVVAVALIAGPAACGGKSERPEPVSDFGEVCAEEARVECARRDECQGGTATLVYGSLENCMTRQAAGCESAKSSPGESNVLEQATLCTTNQVAQTCDEWVGTLTPGCGFTGSKPLGSDCWFNSQCASGFCDEYDYYTQHNVCGVCAAPPLEGDACDSACSAYGVLQCKHDAAGNGRCVKLGALGEHCDDATSCGPHLGCAIAVSTSGGTCLPATGLEGAPCNDETGPLCAFEQLFACNAPMQVCQHAQRAEAGAPCGTLADGSTAVCSSSFCDVASDSSSGVCVAYLADGARCSFGPSVHQRCAPPAVCANGVCAIVGGELCE
jgi:hypothetical protein